MGFPFETKEYYENLLANLKLLPIDNIRLAFVVPFAGTSLYEEYKGLLSKDYTLYTGEYPLLPVEHMTSEELIEMRKKIIKEFYNSDEYIERVIKKVKRNPELCSSFSYFFIRNLHTEGILSDASLKKFLHGV